MMTLQLQSEDDRALLTVPYDGFEVLAIPLLTRGVGSSLVNLDRGQPGSVRKLRFERSGSKVWIIQLNVHFGDTGGAPSDESFARSVLAVLTVVAEDDSGFCVDATELATTDLVGVMGWLDLAGMPGFRVDPARSGLDPARCGQSDDGSVELEATLTFTGAPGEALRAVVPESSRVSVSQRLLLIPVPVGVAPSVFNPASGGYGKMRNDYSRDPSQAALVGVQPRFLLEPAGDPDDAGHVPVRTPIVFSVDPDIPEPYLSAIVEGGNWWQEGFEAAGWKDAYRVEVRPRETDPASAGVNSVWWVHRTGRGWSMGAALCDPTSGVIVKGNVRLGSQRVQQLTMMGEALLTPYGRVDETERRATIERMVLARLRQLAAHEIGHALGFMHNYVSTTHPKASVMDYPHPRLGLTADGTPDLEDAYPVGLGAWDVFTVKHAYGRFSPAELSALREEIGAGSMYLTDHDGHATTSASPDAVPWIFGSDAVSDLDALLRVRAAALADFGAGSVPADRQVGERAERFSIVYLLHRYQIQAVARLVGGVRYGYALSGDAPPPAVNVAGAHQRSALASLARLLSPTELAIPRQALDTLLPPSIRFPQSNGALGGKMGPIFDPLFAVASASWLVAQSLFEPSRLNRVLAQGLDDAEVPSIEELTSVVFSAVRAAATPTEIVHAETAADSLARAAVAALRSGTLHPPTYEALRRALLAEVYSAQSPSWLGSAVDDAGFELPGNDPVLPLGVPI
jgi:hypothetical protein